MTTPSPSTSHGRLLVGVAIVLLAANLRLAVGSLGVVLGPVRDDLGMSPTTAGVLTALPVLCFAVVGLGSHGPVSRLGLHRSAVLVLLAVAAGMALRVLTESPAPFIAASGLALAGAAIGNIILPPLVKTHFPDRVAAVSAAYGAALMAGATVGSVATVPIAEAWGGWRWGLGVWVALAAVSVLPWLGIARRDVRTDLSRSERVPLRAAARSPLVWAFVACFAAQSAGAYAQFGWLAEILVDAGLDDAHAGTMLGIVSGVGIPLTLALPWLVRRTGDRPWLPWAFAALTAAGWTGVLVAPATATWVWAVLLGLGGGAFTWTLTMVGHRTRTPAGATTLSVATQGVGYLLAGLGPLGVGVAHDVTGSWTAPLVALVALSGVIAVAGTVLARPVVLEDTVGT